MVTLSKLMFWDEINKHDYNNFQWQQRAVHSMSKKISSQT